MKRHKINLAFMRLLIAIVKSAALLLLTVSCATQTPAQREAELARYRKEQAEAQARWNRMTPEQRIATLQQAVAMGDALQQMINNQQRDREIRALERMAQPHNYIITGDSGTYTVWPY